MFIIFWLLTGLIATLVVRAEFYLMCYWDDLDLSPNSSKVFREKYKQKFCEIPLGQLILIILQTMLGVFMLAPALMLGGIVLIRILFKTFAHVDFNKVIIRICRRGE